MSAPLYNKLIQYSKEIEPFHMPGHKFGKGAGLDQIDWTKLDATEATGLDNLYEAEEVIGEAMGLMADYYGAKHTVFLTNGSTAGIVASILSVCKPGDQLLVARNCHHSVWSGLVLGGVIPIYISPTWLEEYNLVGEIRQEVIQQALSQYPDVVGALIVSPTYEGIVSNITEIAKVLHEHNKVLIVDEAHGAHFPIHDIFPTSSIRQGADLVIHSMHKTLPAFTQSGLLHICSEKIDYHTIISSLRMIQTSSPSYVMMAAMDYTRNWLEENSSNLAKVYIEPLVACRATLKQLVHLRLFDTTCYDPSKIIIDTTKANITGYQVKEFLEGKYNIGVEAALTNEVILMTTLADTEESLTKLVQALMEIDRQLDFETYEVQHMPELYHKEGEAPREIYFGQQQWIPLREGEGHIVAQNIMLYPPGIPLLCIGERVTKEWIVYLMSQLPYLKGVEHTEGEPKIVVAKQ